MSLLVSQFGYSIREIFSHSSPTSSPQFMVDFIMKRMCGILLSRLQLAATKIVKHPTTNAHARRMREDVIFYRDWLLPKFRVYCDALGWRMPKVHAFEIDEDDLKADGMSWIEDNIDPTEFVSRQCQSDDEFSYISSSRPRAESAPSLISSSSTGSKASFRKLKSLLRQSSSRDDKIAAARLRAANLLRPQPFSDSNIHRLHDLKYARNRAEGRLQDKRVHGSIPDAAELKHSRLFLCVVILVASLFLRSLSVADSTQSTSVSSRGYCHLAAVIAQAYCLRTLLNCLFVYAFEEVDFGQRKFTNMTHGKNFFAMAVKRFTLTIAASVSAISCCIGFVVGVIVREICTLFVDLQKLVDLSHFSLSSSDDVPFFHIVDVVSSFRRIWATFRWGLLNLGFVLPEPLTKKAISFASASFTFFVSNGPLRECVSRPEVEEQWTSIALDISSFITLRLIVFSSALVMMARILLPKQVN